MNMKKGLIWGLGIGALVALALIVVGLIYPNTSPSDDRSYFIATLLGFAGWPLSMWRPFAFVGFLVGRSLPILVNFACVGVAVAFVMERIRRSQ